ncbi:MAG TPA: hypothetical protein VH372_19210 [Actinospica sp.]|jgi:hypothetical protein|nr:hypothetical protein [Actinospica sp.]
MITPELTGTLAAAQAALATNLDWQILNSIPDAAARPAVSGAPAEYVEFLRVHDGAILGAVVILDTKFVEEAQRLIADGKTDLPLGNEEWYCVGKVGDRPVLVRRADGTVWTFPDPGAVWWQSGDFRQIADSFGDFVLEYGLGPGYARLAAAGPDEQWQRLLRHLGRV